MKSIHYQQQHHSQPPSPDTHHKRTPLHLTSCYLLRSRRPINRCVLPTPRFGWAVYREDVLFYTAVGFGHVNIHARQIGQPRNNVQSMTIRDSAAHFVFGCIGLFVFVRLGMVNEGHG